MENSEYQLSYLYYSIEEETSILYYIKVLYMTKRILPLWQYAFFIKKKNQALGLVHSFLNYREATSTLTPGPKVVVTATLRTY